MQLLLPLRRSSLRLQLTLAPVVPCIILAGVLAFTFIGLARLHMESQQAITVMGAKSQIANEVAIATLLCRRYEKDIFLNLDVPSTRAAYLAQWQGAYQILQQAIDQYATHASIDEEYQQIEIWRRESSSYHDALLDIQQAIVSGEIATPQAANAALNPLKDSIRILTESAQEQAHRDSAALQQANTRLTAISVQFFLLLVGVSFVALLLATYWSIRFPSQILKPIYLLQRVTQRLAQGELTARADLPRTDELGVLAGSFNRMAERICQQITELDQSAVVREQNEQLQALLNLVQDLETPAIPLLDGVLLVPMMGHLDRRRIDLLQERTLKAVHTQRAQTVILDLTGIGAIDAKAIYAIDQFIVAIQCLGARTIVTGINAHMAQTMALLGVRFERAQIAARVQEGIAAVIQSTEQISSSLEQAFV